MLDDPTSFPRDEKRHGGGRRRASSSLAEYVEYDRGLGCIPVRSFDTKSLESACSQPPRRREQASSLRSSRGVGRRVIGSVAIGRILTLPVSV